MLRGPQRFFVIAVLILTCATLVLPSAFCQTADTNLAFRRAKNLQRGINASIWFAQSPNDYSVHRLETFTTDDDIALMEKLGLDHVRLSIDPDPLLPWLRKPDTDTPFMSELDKTVHTILAHHLSVIIDIHPESSYKAPLLHGTASVQQFTALWRALAAHYANLDPEHVFFEIMNEPEQDDPFRWQGIESTVAAAIREVAPNNTIIAAGTHWSGLDDLMQLQPIAQPNVIYTFHDYEPFPFTHQGATWTSSEVRPLRGIPYPSSPEAIAPLIQQDPDLHSQLFLENYGLGRWDATRVDATIAFAARWSQLHHAPVYCGEFGVLRDFAPPVMRAQWVHDMRVAFEKYKIGWAMWDYQTNFGLVTKANGTTSPDPAIVTALGLHMPPH